jgi:hypothetical protein
MQRQGANKNKIDEIGEFDIEVECKKAEWLDFYYPHGGTNQYNKEDTKTESSSMPIPPKESARAKKIKKYKEQKPQEFEKMKAKIKEDKNTILNTKSLAKEINKEELLNWIKINTGFDIKLDQVCLFEKESNTYPSVSQVQNNKQEVWNMLKYGSVLTPKEQKEEDWVSNILQQELIRYDNR